MLSTKRLSVFILLLQFYLFFSITTFAQFRFDSWTTDNGLPQNGVRNITQTPDGYLWFTTFDGLVRFDGVKFTTFNKNNTKGINNNRFSMIRSDKEGTIYASTGEEGTLTIYKDGIWKSFTSEEVPGRYVFEMYFDDKGKMIYVVENKNTFNDEEYYSFYRLENDKFETTDEEVKKVFFNRELSSKSGKKWFINDDGITEKTLTDNYFYPFNKNGLASWFEPFEDSQERFWIGSKNQLKIIKDHKLFDLKNNFSFTVDSENHAFWEEEDGSIWFANGSRLNSGTGLVRYKDNKFEVFGKNVGLSDSYIYQVFHDREGTIWLATNKGLNRLRKNVITTYGRNEGLKTPEVYPIFQDSKENIWVGSNSGLYNFKNNNFELVKFTNNGKKQETNSNGWVNNFDVQSLFEDSNGKLWIGLVGDLYVAEGKNLTYIQNSYTVIFNCFFEDENKRVLAATNKGIFVYENYKLVKKLTTNDGLPNDFMTIIFRDSKGTIWFGGYGGLTKYQDGKLTNFTVNEGLAGNAVRTIFEDIEGTLWVGTYDSGLSRFKDGQFSNYTKDNGLFSNGVFAIQEDSRGYFWITSNQGIYRVKRQELNDFAEQKIAKINSVGYGKEDGMLTNECNGGRQPSSFKDNKGRFWFPTVDGISIVDPSLERVNSIPPSVVIEDVKIENESVDFKNGIFIEPGKRNIQIDYTGLSLIKSNQLKFQYKLEGHEAEWVEAKTSRKANYSYLPPGQYTFRVKAVNSDGIWNEEGVKLQLEMKPFFYQTNLFILFCIFLSALFLLLIWKISVYQLEARERKLRMLVAERTKELALANEELQQLANSDSLTKIGNRRKFEEFLAGEWHRAIRFNTEVSLILIDVDYFKLYNDTYGHKAGDECLRKIAEALTTTVNRPTDLVARFGGEEFAIVLGGTSIQGAIKIANKAMRNIGNLQIEHKESEISKFVTISVGIATTYVNLEMTESELIVAADKALYQAKNAGRNQIYASDLLLQSNPFNSEIEISVG